jgi:hypothetical protein
MVRHPKAPTFIVSPDSLYTAEDILYQKHDLFSLIPQIIDNLACLKWLAETRMIANSVVCTRCNIPCHFIANGKRMDLHLTQWYIHNQLNRCVPTLNKSLVAAFTSSFTSSLGIGLLLHLHW